ncbi:Golgi integral membrane protein 4-like isoform X2 [Leptopilina boulardi]|uniref:Golgi integral membrane protein 4-like isoform X2 n=1 Tax=Leptopilina boulardi TaxID=63433 RepID=UPI0021F55766|nr:Golgi integral membrane protein 4-like isoform X2 [Leptopilina boulardi]
MNASRLGRGRGGRLALYGGILMIFVIIIYLYRTASSEMARLHDLHVQCVHQQEALAAQLQVIYEYKVRLEKSLQEEKNSNQALKQELQQRASREKSLRDKDKDNVEILQRYNAMQQKYNILQSENKDLQDECNKRHKLSLEETNKLEVTLRNLRSEINKAHEDKKQSMESLKNKHAQLKVEYDSLWNKNEKLLKNSTECNSQLLHLEKKVFQLNREGEAKKTVVSEYNGDAIADNQQETDHEKSRGNEQVMRPVQPSSSQQKIPTSVGKIPPGNIESSTKASTASISGEKPNIIGGKTKVKLPIGVVPIPVIIDSKIDNDEKKRDNDELLLRKKNAEIIQNSLARNVVFNDEQDVKEKPVAVDIGNLEFQAHLPAGNRHGGQIIDRQINAGWPKVQHGVQEIGDEPHHLGRLAGLDDTAHQGEIGDDQYDNDEFYRDQQPQKSDIRLEEEEDEADEDDQPDYLNNLKPEKH